MDDRRPAYWAIIPADVRYDDALPPNAKLLYGEISSLCDQRGYCYASNSYFVGLYGWSAATIRRLLSALSEQGYIRVEIIRDKQTKAVEERRIYAGLQVGVTPPLKNDRRSAQKKSDPPLKNDFAIKEEQDKENIPPKAPQGGRRPKSPQGGRRPKSPQGGRRGVSVPKWKPDRFEAFWVYYRENARGEDRASASREWDRLKPDDELIRIMGQALRVQVTSGDWQRGIGVPYACRWLKNRRWEDVKRVNLPPPGEEGGTPYEDRELL